ncbi:hypothetical protein CFBP5877_26100 (plasmid) [Agrobacterium tumefaciens]|uniref:HTH luxR-type domain-containing protein n=1 Tax=Agrobacterium tumefaciens TaxID=358 RepID=A0AAE6EIC8_AGRTU
MSCKSPTPIVTLGWGRTSSEAKEEAWIDIISLLIPILLVASGWISHCLTPSAQYPAWLDPKEAAYLNWISVGKTMEEAADLEGVKYNSVKSKLEEARKRFQIHTMPHLVALAIRAGLI